MNNSAADPLLADRLDAALPQTQCTRCGFPDCRAYAEAIADGAADINRCPPGGAEGVLRLAAISGRAVKPLDADCGSEGPRALAVIDEAWCIGCTLCIKACPVDCIVGASKFMHTVVAAQCTGCELCLPACPVDCIVMVPAPGGHTGWQAWTGAQAEQARQRYGWHRTRQARSSQQGGPRWPAEAPAAELSSEAETGATSLPDHQPQPAADSAAQAAGARRAAVAAALARARQRQPG